MWYKNIKDTFIAIGYMKNESEVQITVGIHVIDLLIIAESEKLHQELEDHLRTTYVVYEGKKTDYLRMAFGFSHTVKVNVTMSLSVKGILAGCAVIGTATLQKSTFSRRGKVRLQRLSKTGKAGVPHSCVSFAKRVSQCDYDDLKTLSRLLY